MTYHQPTPIYLGNSHTTAITKLPEGEEEKAMKKMLSVSILVLLVAGCGGGTSTSPTDVGGKIDIGENNATLLGVYGDSLMSNKKVPDLVVSYLGRGMSIKSIAVAGTYSARHLSDFDSLLANNPAVVIGNSGTNDALDNTRAAESKDNHRGMIKKAVANRTIFVLSTLPPVCGYRATNGQNGRVEEINSDLRDLAWEYEDNSYVIFADVALAFANNGGCDLIERVDFNHPNDNGNKLMARTITNALASVSW